MKLIIELNEASRDVIEHVLPRSYFVKPHYVEVTPDGEVEYAGLDPWVNWLSFHLGRGLETHDCLTHGEGAAFSGQFLWDQLKSGPSFGMIGVMNASFAPGNTRIKFFMSDPWTPSSPVTPAHLTWFRDAWSYLSKNYGAFRFSQLIGCVAVIATIMLTHRWGYKSLYRFLRASPHCMRVPFTVWLFVFYDWMLCELFVVLSRETPMDVGIVMLNGIAHFQHSYWDSPASNALIASEYATMLNYLVSQPGITRVDILNGLEQQTCTDVIVWRQKNPPEFFRRLFPTYDFALEQGMTNNTTFYFAAAQERAAFEEKITAYVVDDMPLFRIEERKDTYVSIRVNIATQVNKPYILYENRRWLPFYEHFYVYRVRTGEHVRKSVWISAEANPFTHPTIAEVGRYLLAT
jgi:hypothetical protein